MTTIVTNPIIHENSSIMFQTKISEKFPIFLEKDEKFGIISIQLNEAEIIQKKIGVLFTIDCSQSMSELCEDKKSKMEHAIHTLQRILIEFSNVKDVEIFVSVISFDDVIYEIFDFEKITNVNLDILIEKIQQIKPNLATNIEIALHSARQKIQTYLKENNKDNYKIHHIQLTDGFITSGEIQPKKLLKIINEKYSNTFVGFGINHDSDLLETLSSKKNGDYRFVDKIENSGFVYGEIIHNILYSTLELPRIVIENGKLYDWKTNSWKTEIQLPNLPSGIKKEYHIKSICPDEVNIKLYGIYSNNIKNTEEFIIEFDKIPELIDEDYNIIDSIDLTKYAYRQLTQQLLYEIKNYKINEKNNKMFTFDNNEIELSNKIKNLMENIQHYMKINDLENDNFMKLLLDDMYVCHKIFGTEFGKMFITARQRSQGNQNTYTPRTYISENKNIQKPLKLNRSKTICCSNNSSSENFSTCDNSHIFEEFSDNPYATPKIIKLMRNVSSSY